jgi:hypothetical protein
VDEGALDSLRGRSLLKDADLTGRQLFALIELAAELKAARREHRACARAHVRRHPVPGKKPGCFGDARPPRRRARVERPD